MTISDKIKTLSKSELEKLVLKAASKHKEFDTFLRLNYLDKEQVEIELLAEAKSDIDKLMMKNYKGFSAQLQLANMLAACNKRVTEFSKQCKNKKAEADLLLFILEIPFESGDNHRLGTCFTAYDFKVASILKKLITIVENKIHPDYKIEYAEKINQYLNALHACSRHNDFVYNMPRSI